MRASKEFVLSALAEQSHTPNRALGQNFCIDGPRLKACVEALPLAGEPLLEIGAGLGGLTELLLQKSERVLAIEKDAAMAEYLTRTMPNPRLTIRHEDALRFRFSEVSRPFSVIGNLPYYITTDLVERVLLARPRVFGCMVQREAADRFFAEPQEKTYGALSVIVHLYYSGHILDSFAEECFYPAPNVQSVFVGLWERPDAPAEPIEQVFGFARACLSMRRKTLKNNLKAVPNGLFAIERAGIAPETRAETLSPDEFLKLFRASREA